MSDPKTKLMVGLPCLLNVNSQLMISLFQMSHHPGYEIATYFLNEQMFHDNARNQIVRFFLEKSGCEWLLFLDSDVQPHANVLDMTKHNKDIIGGAPFCWIQGKLLPSIWERAPCERCYNFAVYRATKKAHDPREYRVYEREDGFPALFVWNPFRSEFEPIGDETNCRCRGTGRDPWVYRVSKKVTEEPTLFECDSLGAACLMIHRRAFEKLSFPWFRFLYREDRSIQLTEDHYFCWQAKEAGISIWADKTVPCSHWKTTDLLQVNNLLNDAYKAGVSSVAQQPQKLIIPDAEMIAKALS